MASIEFQKRYQEHEKLLEKTSFFQRAAKSALYSERWKKAGIPIDRLKGFSGLQSLPFISADDLRQTWEKYSIEEIILTKNVAFWFCTSGSMGKKKWMAWTYNDINRSKEEIGKRLLNILHPSDIIMAVTLPPPYISSSIPFRLLEGTASTGMPIEQIALSPDTIQDGFQLLMKRQPTVFFCTPSLAMRLAEEIGRNTPRILKQMAKDKKSAKLHLASLITKIKTVKPKQVFKKMRVGFFTSEPLAPFRKAIEELYDIEVYDYYGFTEGFGAGIECSLHEGLHFPSLNGIIEIIPEKELLLEEKNPGYIPKTLLFSEVEKGLVGELVITDFKEAMPLIRYRLRDKVKVLAADECSCGSITPRLEIIGRTDDVINLGIIRFSTIEFDSILKSNFDHGQVALWEVYVSREGFKPKLTLSIEPSQVSNEEQFKEEILAALLEFRTFKLGLENELFVFDSIKIVDKLQLEIIGQGKRRRIRYDPNFLKAVKY
ncbi:MAG: GH3 auxin-responsive promoter family protein [Candidatus Heimdallarchaeota archaeon]|nr:GH3 auxin-responsive promoter family protein [Candidatus Heimdallarchaeota archaeon]